MTPENTTRTSLTSVFGRAAYDYDNRYYAEFSFRYDGSKFRSDLRWASSLRVAGLASLAGGFHGELPATTSAT